MPLHARLLSKKRYGPANPPAPLQACQCCSGIRDESCKPSGAADRVGGRAENTWRAAPAAQSERSLARAYQAPRRAHPRLNEVSTVSAVPAVQVHNLRKEFIRRDGGSRKRGRRRRVAALQGVS